MYKNKKYIYLNYKYVLIIANKFAPKGILIIDQRES